MPDLTARPAIEDEENTRKLKGAGTKQPAGRVVGIIRRHWREKQYCGSLRNEGDRAVTTGRGQATSALFMPVDRKASRTRQRRCFLGTPICTVGLSVAVVLPRARHCQVFICFSRCTCSAHRFPGCAFRPASEMPLAIRGSWWRWTLGQRGAGTLLAIMSRPLEKQVPRRRKPRSVFIGRKVKYRVHGPVMSAEVC